VFWGRKESCAFASAGNSEALDMQKKAVELGGYIALGNFCKESGVSCFKERQTCSAISAARR
jgi:hypothetical protein